MKNFRDIEQLSAYLDGQLSPSDSVRLESRISSDPELDSVLSDLRTARGILRKLPARKAPRNFTMTRKMVGLKPPLPRTYSFFRFSSAFATILLFLTFAANVLPRISLGAAAPAVAQEGYGMGGGCANCGGAEPVQTSQSVSAAPLAPAATEAPAQMDTAPTETARIAESPTADASLSKEAGNLTAPQDQPQVNAERDSIIPSSWQIILLIIGLISAGIAFVINQNARKKWN
jgi:anti-sigma factor RsiW